MTTNDELAGRLEEFADLLEAQDVEYKPRAYRNAAETVRELSIDIEGLAAEGQEQLPNSTTSARQSRRKSSSTSRQAKSGNSSGCEPSSRSRWTR